MENKLESMLKIYKALNTSNHKKARAAKNKGNNTLYQFYCDYISEVDSIIYDLTEQLANASGAC